MTDALHGLGGWAIAVGQLEDSLDFYSQALDLAKRFGDRRQLADAEKNLGIIYNRLEQPEKALEHYQRSRDLFSELDFKWGVAATTHNIAMIYNSQQQLAKAQAEIERSIALHRAINHKRGESAGYSVLGVIHRAQYKHEAAKRAWRRALQLQHEIDARWLCIMTIIEFGLMAASEGNLTEAVQLLHFASQHPSAYASSHDLAVKTLNEIKDELSPALFEEAVAQAANSTLDTLVARLTKV